MKTPKTPREVKTFGDLCNLPRDNISSTTHWIILNENVVTIAEQRIGSPAKTMVTIPRRVFHRFIDWYNTGKLHR